MALQQFFLYQLVWRQLAAFNSLPCLSRVSHNLLDQCAGAIQAQCGEPAEGGSPYRPL